MDNIYCPIRAVIRNRTQGSLAYPTAAERRSLQWGSDGRSRYAEPMGRWEVCYAPQRRCFATCSGFQTVGPASRNIGGRWEVCYTPQRRCFAACSGFQRIGPATRNLWGRWEVCYAPHRRCFAACSGFHDIGPAPWNPQLIVIHKQTIYKQKKALCQVGEKLVRARPNIKPFT